ncbi:hypothetical protein GQX74_015260 [Glossina fuscipes]|nr:hypothetical protein GQX74_015260 [Glossina fuscipes]
MSKHAILKTCNDKESDVEETSDGSHSYWNSQHQAAAIKFACLKRLCIAMVICLPAFVLNWGRSVAPRDGTTQTEKGRRVNATKRLREEGSADTTPAKKSKRTGDGINPNKEVPKKPKQGKEEWTVVQANNRKAKPIKLVNKPDAMIIKQTGTMSYSDTLKKFGFFIISLTSQSHDNSKYAHCAITPTENIILNPLASANIAVLKLISAVIIIWDIPSLKSYNWI